MPDKTWPLTMTEASHIARIPYWRGTDWEIALEYRVPEELIRQIRREKNYNGVSFSADDGRQVTVIGEGLSGVKIAYGESLQLKAVRLETGEFAWRIVPVCER